MSLRSKTFLDAPLILIWRTMTRRLSNSSFTYLSLSHMELVQRSIFLSVSAMPPIGLYCPEKTATYWEFERVSLASWRSAWAWVCICMLTSVIEVRLHSWIRSTFISSFYPLLAGRTASSSISCNRLATSARFSISFSFVASYKLVGTYRPSSDT